MADPVIMDIKLGIATCRLILQYLQNLKSVSLKFLTFYLISPTTAFSDEAKIGKFGRAMSRLNLSGPMRKRINGIRFKQCWDDIQVMNSTKSAVQLLLNLLNHLVHAHFILGPTRRRPLMAHLMGTLAPTEAVSVSNCHNHVIPPPG